MYKQRRNRRRGTNRCPKCGNSKNADFDLCYDCNKYAPESSRRWNTLDSLYTEFYVYILRLNDGELYVGQTRDLERRLMEHEEGKSSSTSGRNPKLIWSNIVDTREQATNLELQLKNTKRDVLLDMVENFNSPMTGVGNTPDYLIIRNKLDRLGDQFKSLTTQIDQLTRKIDQVVDKRGDIGGLTGFWMIITVVLLVILFMMQCRIMDSLE